MVSPNVNSYLDHEGAVNVDPMKRITEDGPDSLDAICNVFEMYRSMKFLLGKGTFSTLCGMNVW
jgi:hypothetical protein